VLGGAVNGKRPSREQLSHRRGTYLAQVVELVAALQQTAREPRPRQSRGDVATVIAIAAGVTTALVAAADALDFGSSGWSRLW